MNYISIIFIVITQVKNRKFIKDIIDKRLHEDTDIFIMTNDKDCSYSQENVHIWSLSHSSFSKMLVMSKTCDIEFVTDSSTYKWTYGFKRPNVTCYDPEEFVEALDLLSKRLKKD